MRDKLPPTLERALLKWNHLTEAILVADKAGCAPWCQPTTSAIQRIQRAKSTGPFNVVFQHLLSSQRWGKSAHRRRCAACPMHHIALCDAPSRVNRFSAIKCFHLNKTRSKQIIPTAGLPRDTHVAAHCHI
ncbi:hypothetical protein [Hoeflea sp. TYP-13]|uniref:hypothetical protein n=1 Tax=Hoeflea sp. TYP-13 TaxID=3230023 RepID=UPI0034C6C766